MSHQVSMIWSAPNPAPSQMGFNVYRGITSGGESTKLNSSPNVPVPTLQNPFVDNDAALTAGTTYFYVVRTVDLGTNEESSNSNEISVTIPLPPPPPAAPTSLQEISVS